MKNILKVIGVVVGCGVLAAFGLYIGYSYYIAGREMPTKPSVENRVIDVVPEKLLMSEEAPLPEVSAVTIAPSTKIVYKYVYKGDGHVENSEEEAPYFMIGLTEEEAARFFIDWTIESFSVGTVVMSKVIEGNSAHHYIIGVLNGYVTVFYEQPINGTNVKEITDTPVNSLSPDERQRLKEGISVVGDENLVKILEDYGS